MLDTRLSVTGLQIDQLYFLVESLFFLSSAIRDKGPTLWAKYEVLVFLFYFIAVAIFLLVCNVLVERADMNYFYDYVAQPLDLVKPMSPLLSDDPGSSEGGAPRLRQLTEYYYEVTTFGYGFNNLGGEFPLALNQIFGFVKLHELGLATW